MIKILFICHGNICRSTMAQYVLQHMVDTAGISEQFYIDSAATSYEEIGNGVHHGTRRKLKREGIYCGDHRARHMELSDYDNFDYIIGMDTANIRNLNRFYNNDPKGKIYKIVGKDEENKIYQLMDFSNQPRNIADPWYTGNFDVTYEDVVRGCEGLLKTIE